MVDGSKDQPASTKLRVKTKWQECGWKMLIKQIIVNQHIKWNPLQLQRNPHLSYKLESNNMNLNDNKKGTK